VENNYKSQDFNKENKNQQYNNKGLTEIKSSENRNYMSFKDAYQEMQNGYNIENQDRSSRKLSSINFFNIFL